MALKFDKESAVLVVATVFGSLGRMHNADFSSLMNSDEDSCGFGKLLRPLQ